MRDCRLLACLLLLTSPLAAQNDVAALNTRLIHQTLYLRGQWQGGKLKFDSSGKLRGAANCIPFTTSGVDIESVKAEAHGLKLEGNRVVLVFRQDNISRKNLEKLRIEIEAPADGDYGPALNQVFTSNLADFVPALPSYWQVYGRAHFLPDSASSEPVAPAVKLNKIGGDVLAPKVLFAPSPQYDLYARKLQIAGDVLVYLQVDAQGKPGHIRILRPLGAGLDEAAVKSVSRYKFKPAEDNGVPIPVEMNVDVNFQIF